MTTKATNVSEGLEPCPFCGTVGVPSDPTRHMSADITCGNEDCPVRPSAYGRDIAAATARWNTRATLSPPLPSPEVELVRDSFDPDGDNDGGELLVHPGQTARKAGHYEARDNFEPLETADGKPQRFIGGCVVEGGQEVIFTYEPGMAAHVARLLNAALSTSLPSPLGVEP